MGYEVHSPTSSEGNGAARCLPLQQDASLCITYLNKQLRTNGTSSYEQRKLIHYREN